MSNFFVKSGTWRRNTWNPKMAFFNVTVTTLKGTKREYPFRSKIAMNRFLARVVYAKNFKSFKVEKAK